LVLDLLRSLEIEYAAIVPGATFRGIQDSAVNYTLNRSPELILCNQEIVTVALARGYARVTGRPMAVILHNIVGLLFASMGIYDAWCDRVPLLAIGGAAPTDATRRRPWIDWIHSANVQGEFVRSFTKWDNQPGSVAAIPEAMLRANRIATTVPMGPVYVAIDTDLQEQPIDGSFPLPDASLYRPGSLPRPSDEVVTQLTSLLLNSDHPVAFADASGRDPDTVAMLAELAELLAIPFIDNGSLWHNFPTPHAFDFFGMQDELAADADLIVGFDALDLPDGPRSGPDSPRPTVVHVSADELIHRGGTADHERLLALDLAVSASPAATLPLLLTSCRDLLRADAAAVDRIEKRRTELAGQQQELRARQRAWVTEQCARPGITETRLAVELWDVVKDEEYVFTTGLFRNIAPGVYDLPTSQHNVGGALGGGAVGTALGVALGSALALRDSGRLPIAVLGDGETLACAPALWTAARHRIPCLMVLANNRSYFNDEAHQTRVARMRDRPVENRRIAMRMEDPPVDFATLATSFGVWSRGPLKDAGQLKKSLTDALNIVRAGQPALVDVWVEDREVK
jgi:thiamine pyrophosphate-dependent acetolactate synthase large subunit-like protein